MSVPLGRAMRDWRRVLVPLGGLAVLNVAAYALAVYPLSVRVSSAERRADAARTQLVRAQQEENGARATIASSARADEDLRRFYSDVLPSHIAGARRLTYARLAQLADETNLLYDRRSYDEDTAYKGALRRLRITMELEGEYRDIREFIHRLETSPEFVVIEHVALGEGRAADAPLTLSLRLATYFRSADDGS